MYFNFMGMDVLSMWYVCALHEVSMIFDFLKLEVQPAVIHCVCAGNWTLILFKSNKCSSPLDDLSSPFITAKIKRFLIWRYVWSCSNPPLSHGYLDRILIAKAVSELMVLSVQVGLVYRILPLLPFFTEVKRLFPKKHSLSLSFVICTFVVSFNVQHSFRMWRRPNCCCCCQKSIYRSVRTSTTLNRSILSSLLTGTAFEGPSTKVGIFSNHLVPGNIEDNRTVQRMWSLGTC